MNFDDLTKAEADKSKGVISTYNDIPVEQQQMYYDRDETDKAYRVMFDNAMKGLSDLNSKLKDEVEKESHVGKKVDLSIDKVN